MSLTAYPVKCYAMGCEALAAYKIAARWSDGATTELKTYSLACPTCLADLFAKAKIKQSACRLAAGETLDPPGVYELLPQTRDQRLTRRPDLE